MKKKIKKPIKKSKKPASFKKTAKKITSTKSKKTSKKRVYFFGNGKAEGTGKMKDLLGGKGANLADMTSLGIPVPSGFTITTEICIEYYKNGNKFSKDLKTEVSDNLRRVEAIMNR